MLNHYADHRLSEEREIIQQTKKKLFEDFIRIAIENKNSWVVLVYAYSSLTILSANNIIDSLLKSLKRKA